MIIFFAIIIELSAYFTYIFIKLFFTPKAYLVYCA